MRYMTFTLLMRESLYHGSTPTAIAFDRTSKMHAGGGLSLAAEELNENLFYASFSNFPMAWLLYTLRYGDRVRFLVHLSQDIQHSSSPASPSENGRFGFPSSSSWIPGAMSCIISIGGWPNSCTSCISSIRESMSSQDGCS